MADTAYLVGCCERQRHLNCNILSPFFFHPRVMIIFVNQCVIMINVHHSYLSVSHSHDGFGGAATVSKLAGLSQFWLAACRSTS